MADNAQGQLAIDARSLANATIERVGIDPRELPPEVLNRLEERARIPDRRLTVGRYVVVGELGRGGMGVVYEAWDPRIERRVAIKTIEPDLVSEEDRDEVVERFRRETKIVGRLHHPSIVTIFDYGEDKEPVNGLPSHIYFYVMEFLEGQSLARVMRERRSMPDVEAVSIVADIAEALHISHAAGVIHRDIKPSNIFLRNGVQAVLLDFGIAKTGSVALTRQGQILGTPSYLAPERLREKERPVDGRADIFSLGVLLFTMLTGEAPFVGEDVYDVIDKIAKESHPKLARSTPAGQALSQVIDRMLAKRPEDRYGSALEAAQALRRALDLLRAAAEPDTDSAARAAAPAPSAPEVADLMASPSGLRAAVVESTSTELASPSSALPSPPDEEDTGRHVLPRASFEPVVGPARQSSLRSGHTPPPPLRSQSDVAHVEEAPTEMGDDRVKVADLFGTRPELALQRETRELEGRGKTAPPPLPSVIAPDGEPPKVIYRAVVEADAEEGYRAHGEGTEEATDDQTVSDREKRPPLLAAQAPTEPRAPIVPGPKSGPQGVVTKSPSGGTAVAGKGPRPAGPRGPTSSPEAPIVERRESLAPTPRAGGIEHTEQATDAEGGLTAVRPGPADAGEDRARTAPGGPVVRAVRVKEKNKRPRIEASLVDEEDVVVRPAPLEELKPDEMPTHTGFRRPDPPRPVETRPSPASRSLLGDVRVRGDSRVRDPAELPSGETTGAAVLDAKSEPAGEVRGRREDGPSAGRELEGGRSGLELAEEPGPVPELDLPKSAAVARRTIGPARGGPGKREKAAPVQVKVSGNVSWSADRLRLVRRRGFMLVAAMLLAVGVGLLLGRLKQRGPEGEEPTRVEVQPVEPPRATSTSPIRGTPTGEPEILAPRTAQDLLQDAATALGDGRVGRAERLYESAVRASPERSKLRAQAMLGRADALRQLGRKEEAVELYRAVMGEQPRTSLAEEAKVALGELGVVVDRPRPRPEAPPPEAPRAPGAAPQPPKKEEPKAAPELAKEVTSAMSPEEKCRAIQARYLNDPTQAVDALTRLSTDEPGAPCVYWGLGNAFMKLRRNTSAIGAFRRYLELKPNAENRAAVEARIKQLEAQPE